MKTDISRPEVLAPAGNWDSLRAAAANGADAVYFGLSQFNARARAENFTVDDLAEVMTFLHARNVRGFVAFNILIFSDELAEAEQFLRAIARAGVDAVIVQDLGLLKLARRVAPSLPVHASTQMTLADARGIEFVRKLGVSRVVLARELSLTDIRKITAETDLPVEVFVHGALCVAYSGQCLTSEAIGGRSANRGECAQACRLPYELMVDGEKRDLGDRAYLLSPQDLAAYDHVAELVRSGVASFKIEGRLKGGPYVAAATEMYRQAVDAAVAKQNFRPTSREVRDLTQTFSRGFIPGFLDGVDHQKTVRGRFPKSRGVRLGTVLRVTKRTVEILFTESGNPDEFIKAGDGVLFDIGKPETKEPGGRVWEVTALPPRGGKAAAALFFESEPESLGKIPAGCDVWKTDDPVLRKRLEQTYASDNIQRKVPITAELVGRIDDDLMLVFQDESGRRATAIWPGPIEAAKKRPTTKAEIEEQLNRLGDTPFALGTLKLDLPDNIMLPKSVLNDLRRQASATLLKAREKRRAHAVVSLEALESLRSEITLGQSAEREPQLNVLVRNLLQLRAVLDWRATASLPTPPVIYCDFEDMRKYTEAVQMAREASVRIGLAGLRIWKPGEEGFHSLVVRAKPDLFLVRNLASITYYQEQLPEAELVGDFSLNVANELTAELLFDAGLTRLTPSCDLNWEQLAAMLSRSDAGRYEPIIHQHIPMFHMEHCVFAAFMSEGRDFRDCGRPCETHRVELRDRASAVFPVHPDTGCRNTVFNSVPQSAAEYVGRMRAAGVASFRVDLLRETPEEIPALLNLYVQVLTGKDDGTTVWRRLRALNQLGVTRGTLQLA